MQVTDTKGGAKPQTARNPGPTVLKSAVFMSLGTLLSRIFGLVRDIVFAANFPITVKDAFVVAFRLPNMFRRLFGEGSLSASFVPIFVDYLTQKEGESRDDVLPRARNLADAVLTLLIIFTGVLTAIGIIYMEPIMRLLVSGDEYQNVPGKFELTVKMAQIMFGFVALVTLYALLMSILNVYKRFFIPAVAPALFNFILILGALLPDFQFHGDQLAWSVLIGGVFQLVMVVFPLVKMGEMPRATLHLWTHGVKLFFRNLIPSVLGMSVLQVMTLLNTNFASHLPEGSHSYIYFADRLLEFPLSLISVSLGVALLPTLSEHWARGDKEGMLAVAQKNIRLLLFLSLPCTVGFYFMSRPIVEVVYMRGAFSETDVATTAMVLQIYSLLLIFTGFHRVTVPSFYAIKNTWLPAVTSVLSLALHYFVASWAVETYGLPGLVGATTFTALSNLTMLLISYKIIFGRIGLWPILKTVLHMIPSLVAIGLFSPFAYEILKEYTGRIIALGVAIAGAGFLFFIINTVLKHPETTSLTAILKRKLKRS